MCKMNLYIRFSKLLLNIGLILATNLVFCIDDNLKVIHRLPNNTIPVHYNIYLTLHLKEGNFTFYGESNVNIEIRFASSQISLHSKELEINETATTLVNDKGTVYKPMEYTYNNATNILILHFDHELSPSFYTLNMRFTGNLSESTDSRKTGIFKIPYTSEQGNTTWLAATHFEPDGARQVFPCWDEPALKATFNISIMNYDKYMALSNMPRRNISFEPNDMTWTYFDTTPIMSTYLVVIVAISRADFITISNANLNVSTLFRFSLQSQVRFAQDIAERAMTFLIQYTNNSEKVPKVDNILIPNFPIEGMENWGLITYKESSSTYDDRTDPTYKRKDVASLVAHEIAHQWFGNLVTPSWWSYIWLSEGLATFFETYIIDKIFKDWRTMDFFVVKTLHNCLMVDIGLMNSVTLKLDNVLEDELLFSIISKSISILVSEVYQKASVLIRMLYNTITDKVFRNGLITYLSTHQFSSTTPDDLWSAMQSALDESDVPHEGYRIREVMNTWINQKRYPVINVMRNYETGEVTLSQTCFRTQDTAECINSTWWIPVTYATQSNPDFSNVIPKFWLRPDQNISFRINPNDWIILNLQQTGYYRINYDTRNWHKISYYLNSENYANVHVLNRAQIISDSYVLSMDENKEINGVLFVNLVSYLERETDYVAWYPMFKIVEYIWSSKYLFLTEAKSIKIRIMYLLNTLLKNVGYDENSYDDDITKLKRQAVLKWTCILGHAGCKEIASERLSQHLANPDTHKIPKWKEEFTYCFGLKTAKRTIWNKVFQLYQKGSNKTLLKSLSCVEDPDIIISYLNIIAFNTSLFSNMDHFLVFRYILEKHVSNNLVLNYILNNFGIIKPRLLKTPVVIGFILSNVYSVQQIDQIQKFSESNINQDPNTLLIVQQLIEKRKKFLKNFIDIFKKRFFSRPISNPII